MALHKDLTGADLHANKLHAATHRIDGTDPIEHEFNVKAYGALGDGITDDVTAIQNAINAVVATGGVLYFPYGNYKKSDSLTIAGSNVKIIFAPGAKITETVKGKGGFVVSAGYSNIQFEDVALYGISDNAGPSAYGIGVEDQASDVVFRNCYFTGYTGGIIASRRNARITVERCQFYNMFFIATLGAGGYGIVFQTAYDTKTTGCYFDGSVERHHIYIGKNPLYPLESGYSHIVSGNIFVGLNKANYTTGFEYLLKVMGNQRVTISNNTFRDGVGHIWLTQDPEEMVISGNIFSGISKGDSAYSSAIRSSGAGTVINNVIIANNIFKELTSADVIHIQEGTGIKISNNVIKTVVDGHGIVTELSLTDCIISDNFIDDLGTGRGMYIGLTWSAGNESTNLIIRNNDVTGYFGIVLKGVSTGIIENNRITSTSLQCLLFYSVKFTGLVRNNKFVNGNYGIGLNAESTDPVIIYGNVFEGQATGTIENAGSAFLIEPIKNPLISSNRKNYQTIGTVAPTTGTWSRGDIAYIVDPAASGYIGWICVTAGTPGTWKGFGLIEA